MAKKYIFVDNIIEEYGGIKLCFSSVCKGRFIYVSANLKYRVFGTLDYRAEAQKEMSIKEIYDTFDNIELSVLK